MTNVRFHILVVCNFVLLSCKGQAQNVFPPSNQNMIVVLPGSTPRLEWTFNGDRSRAILSWFFTKRGTPNETEIATKFRTQDAIIETNSSLPRVAIENPATLVLKNVDERYNGKYRFSVLLAGGGGDAEVELFIAAQPSVTIANCSHPTTVNEGSDVTCVCKSQGGNPPANVTWYKDGVQIGNTSYGGNILTLTKVTKQDAGRYTCKAQSFTLTDEKSFDLIVHYKPINTKIKVPKEAYIGQKLEITCEFDGLPKPNFTITHNGTTRIVSINANYAINRGVQYNDAGIYTCIANNSLGNDTDSGSLIVKGTITPTATPARLSPTPTSTASKTSSTGTAPKPTSKPPGSPPVGLIVGIVIGVLLLLLIVGVVVYCYKSKQKERRNHGDIGPVAGNHYELDEEPSPGDNAYDTVGPVGESGSKKKSPEKDSLPPVYAAVDKSNRQGNTLYASLDTDALKRESKKEPAGRAPQTEYASIDFAKPTDVPKADLV